MGLMVFIRLSIIRTYSESKSLSNQGDQKITIDYKNKTDGFWKKHLKPEVYNICRQNGTEQAGSGKYNHFYEKGRYYCACCGGGHAVYKSDAKFDSGTGWPSFGEPVSSTSVTVKEDREGLTGWLFPRMQVMYFRCGSHSAHVFNDGTKEHTGLRYCMNSLALTFVPDGKESKHRFEEAIPQEGAKS